MHKNTLQLFQSRGASPCPSLHAPMNPGYVYDRVTDGRTYSNEQRGPCGGWSHKKTRRLRANNDNELTLLVLPAVWLTAPPRDNYTRIKLKIVIANIATRRDILHLRLSA